MAKYSVLFNLITKSLKKNPGTVFHIEGSPGTAKTALTLDIAKHFGLSADRVLVFRPSIHDPVDLMGIPSVTNNSTVWNPPAFLWHFREGSGPGLIIWDELAQAGTMMQNAIAGLLLDKFVGTLKLDKQVMQISTGNRSKDKAGANKLLTQLGNRINIQEMVVSLDDTTQYYLDRGMNSNLVAFLRMRPGLLNKFDPNQISNPTPRSWDLGDQAIPEDLSDGEYLMAWKGFVGEGAATEWAAARKLMADMPNPDYCILKPQEAELPTTTAAMYAITTALAIKSDRNILPRAWEYVQRLPREFHVLYMVDIGRRDRSLFSLPEVTRFALENQELFVG